MRKPIPVCQGAGVAGTGSACGRFAACLRWWWRGCPVGMSSDRAPRKGRRRSIPGGCRLPPKLRMSPCGFFASPRRWACLSDSLCVPTPARFRGSAMPNCSKPSNKPDNPPLWRTLQAGHICCPGVHDAGSCCPLPGPGRIYRAPEPACGGSLKLPRASSSSA